MKFFFTLFSILCCFYSSHCFSQHIPDSLKKYSYSELVEKVGIHYPDSVKANPYLQAYQNKAKLENRVYKLASAYYNYGLFSPKSIEEKFMDSIIELTKKQENEKYPALALLKRGFLRYEKENYREAFDDYLSAYQLYIKHNSLSRENELIIKIAMGALRNLGGDYENGLKNAKEVLELEKENFNNDNALVNDYLVALNNLSLDYLRVKKPDSAINYTKRGIELSLKTKDSFYYYEFVNIGGVIEYMNKNYESAYDSITKSSPYRADNNSILNDYFYKIKIAFELKNDTELLLNFKKLDSTYTLNRTPIRELPEAYEIIVDYYKRINDNDNQLKYINRLLEIDSIIETDLNFLNNEIIKHYDIPLLIKEKETLINGLKKDKKKFGIGLGVLGSVSVILIGLLVYYVKKQKALKKRFEEILSTEPDQEIAPQATKKISGVSKEVITAIQNRLTVFEAQNQFLDNTITLHTLSKKLDTNSNYLSKVINHYKQKNFSTYLSDLRVEFVIKQLKTNEQFKMYSIKGIAKEVGFNNETSFSKAFYKRTGMYPSYFIKQLEKVKN